MSERMFVLNYKYYGEEGILNEMISKSLCCSTTKKQLYRVAVLHFQNEYYNKFSKEHLELSSYDPFTQHYPLLKDCINDKQFKKGYNLIYEEFKNHIEWCPFYEIVEVINLSSK